MAPALLTESRHVSIGTITIDRRTETQPRHRHAEGYLENRRGIVGGALVRNAIRRSGAGYVAGLLGVAAVTAIAAPFHETLNDTTVAHRAFDTLSTKEEAVRAFENVSTPRQNRA